MCIYEIYFLNCGLKHDLIGLELIINFFSQFRHSSRGLVVYGSWTHKIVRRRKQKVEPERFLFYPQLVIIKAFNQLEYLWLRDIQLPREQDTRVGGY